MNAFTLLIILPSILLAAGPEVLTSEPVDHVESATLLRSVGTIKEVDSESHRLVLETPGKKLETYVLTRRTRCRSASGQRIFLKDLAVGQKVRLRYVTERLYVRTVSVLP